MPLRLFFLVLAFVLTALPCSAEIPGKQSDWHGFVRHDFSHDGRNCILVSPEKPAEGKPWVWRARFFGHEPQADIALLKLGFHIAYCDVSNMFGSPTAVKHWDSFYELATKEFGLAEKPALEGMSRGGLIIYNWAIANPEKVACIYADAPVCDFRSWPAGRGKGKGSEKAWQDCLKAYGFTEKEAVVSRCNPIDNLRPLAAAKVPILHVVGLADDVVPVAENSAVIEDRYRKIGGEITVISKHGVGHHPHSLKDPKPIVDFIVKHTLNTEKKNAEKKNAKEKPASDDAAAQVDLEKTFYQGRTLADWVSCLESENNFIRFITVARLNGEGPCLEFFVPHLLSLTTDENSKTAKEAIGALAQLGDAAAPAEPLLQEIAAALDHPNQQDALAALGQIGGSSPEKRVVLLRKMLMSESPASRVIAARGLWKLEKDKQYLGVVLESTASLEHCPQVGTVIALSHFAAQEEAFLPELEKFSRDNPDRPERAEEEKVLSHIRIRSLSLIAARRARATGD